MANPFLVLGGVAVGIVTAGFGILQVPGWIANAQDASAQNDIAQVTIAEAASLSVTGNTLSDAELKNIPANIGVDVSVRSWDDVAVSQVSNSKDYGVVVVSESGNAFSRVNGGDIIAYKVGATTDATHNVVGVADAAAAKTAADTAVSTELGL